jgi:hypothetical protein
MRPIAMLPSTALACAGVVCVVPVAFSVAMAALPLIAIGLSGAVIFAVLPSSGAPPPEKEKS